MANIRQKVALEGIRFFSYHGFYPEEQLLGNEYMLDIETEAEVTDYGNEDITRTVNYERLLSIAQEEMTTPRKLLETAAHAMLEKIRHEFLSVTRIRVVIRKLNPPLTAEVNNSLIELNFSR
jgi:7,8-dihydroneopterin aldolase/epimerase/oxygenase